MHLNANNQTTPARISSFFFFSVLSLAFQLVHDVRRPVTSLPGDKRQTLRKEMKSNIEGHFCVGRAKRLYSMKYRLQRPPPPS